jgi:hypothetical protein
MRSPSLNERRLTWWSKVAFDHFLVSSLFYNEDRRSSSSDSKFNKNFYIGAMSGNSSIAVCKVGISHSMGRVALTPWMIWKGVKPMVVLTIVR